MSAVLNVLHVAQPCEGGVARYVAAVAADQAVRGWEVTVACPGGGRLAADLTGLGIRHLPWPATRSPGPASLAESLRLAGVIDRAGPQVVHLHAAKAGLAGRLVLRGRLPTLMAPHGWSWLAVDGATRAATVAWERAAAHWTTLFVCVGAAEAEDGRAHGVRGRYAVIRNGVDLSRFRAVDDAGRATARMRLGVGPDVPLAVCVGRVTRQKGQDVLLAAWPSIRRRCAGAELALVGDGELLPGLREQGPPGVRFAGDVPDVRTWLAAADVVVAPSRWEGLSLTLLEALATGRSVVASAVPGLAEAVTPHVGALVTPEDPAALADAVARRLGDRRLSGAEGRAAASRAARFDLHRTFDRLAAATLAAVSPGGGPAMRPGGDAAIRPGDATTTTTRSVR